jgi:hypothetical protein
MVSEITVPKVFFGQYQKLTAAFGTLKRNPIERIHILMPTFELTPEELELLQEILTSDLSELRMEIADTDNSRFKDGLKHRKQKVMDIMEKLGKNGAVSEG